MLQVARFILGVVLAVLVSAAGCDEKTPSPDSGPSGSVSESARPSPMDSPPQSPNPTDDSTGRLSGVANRTGVTITKDGAPIDAAGLAALGWSSVDAVAGEASWSDPALGQVKVTWEIPDQRALAFFDVSFWGEVTGENLAINPSMSTTGFKGGPVETTAHATGGTRAEAPTRVLRVEVPEQSPGSTASVSINLGFPQPVLITYSYLYE
ncbi:hypothetical protein F0U44_12490 [Nocardioides humilatus]|uniref:Lipoprotein n=1 Tax=Nocardioides humilatus TaxID=2607660 RepID=A0A5B1LI56_9ACTN|nr:hypothetical protein [Nocardioides humilatus]KAA1419257.1 hypothetical protein F0U44_12490 [Nocardioides humilatus]